MPEPDRALPHVMQEGGGQKLGVPLALLLEHVENVQGMALVARRHRREEPLLVGVEPAGDLCPVFL